MIRIGIVGCGRILAAHLQGYRRLREAGFDQFRITALCSRKRQTAESYLNRHRGPTQRPPCSEIAGDPLAVEPQYLDDFQDDVQVRTFDRYEEMLGAGVVDAVNDLTHHELHHDVARIASENNLHLLTQKPLAVSVPAAHEMCDWFAARKLTLGVFENWHYRPRTRQLQRLVELGAVGEPQMFVMGSIGAWWAPNRVVANTPWRHSAALGGGISLDMGVHQLHWIRQIAGELSWLTGQVQIVETRRWGVDEQGQEFEVECDADDTYWVQCRTKSGVAGQLFASWAGCGAPTMIAPGPVLYTSRCRVAGDGITWENGQKQSLEDAYRQHVGPDLQEQDFPRGLRDEFAVAQWDWLAAIEAGRDPETSGRSGLADLSAAQAILDSARSGERVAFP